MNDPVASRNTAVKAVFWLAVAFFVMIGNMNRFVAILGAGIILAALAAAGYLFRMSETGISHPAAPPVDQIRIANIGMYSVFNVIAKEKGYFAENGLDAQVEEYDSGATSIAALLSGEADVIVAADFVGVRNMFDRSDIRVLAQVSDHDVFRVIARRDKGIEEPKDLRGKTIGLTKKTAGEFYLGRFLTANGLAFEDVTLVDLAPAGMIEGLRGGTLDAVLIFEPHAFDLREEFGGRAVTWSAQGSEHALGLIYTTQDFIDRHPSLAERYLRALVMAEEHLRAHEDEARRIVGRSLEYTDAYIAYIWPKFSFGILLDQGTLLAMEAEARWLIGNGLVDATMVPNYLDRISFDGLERTRPSAVTIIH